MRERTQPLAVESHPTSPWEAPVAGKRLSRTDVLGPWRDWFRSSACLVLCLLWLGPGTLPSHAAFSSMYVFGDSLSAVDGAGTQYPPPPGASAGNYWKGRYSNGRVWVEYLAEQLGITIKTNSNVSCFGNGTPWIYRTQIYGNFYPPPDLGTSLCVYWPACSDCFALVIFGGTNDVSSAFPELMTNLNASVGLLYSQGMRSLLMPNAVDISLVPFFTYTLDTFGLGAVAPYGVPSRATIRTNVIQYNAFLATAINQLRAQYPGLTIYAPDFYTRFNEGIAHPEVYGLTKTDIDALEDPALKDRSFDGPGADYVFWDYLHPTTKVHAFMAAFAVQSLQAFTLRPLAGQETTTLSTNDLGSRVSMHERSTP